MKLLFQKQWIMISISDVSSPSLGPPARPSEANFAMLKPARSPKTSKRESSSPPEAQNRYPEPARDTRRFFHTLLEPTSGQILWSAFPSLFFKSSFYLKDAAFLSQFWPFFNKSEFWLFSNYEKNNYVSKL